MRKYILTLCIFAAIPAIASASLSTGSVLAPAAGIERSCSGGKDKDKGCGSEKSSVTTPTTLGSGCCPGKGGSKKGDEGSSDA